MGIKSQYNCLHQVGTARSHLHQILNKSVLKGTFVCTNLKARHFGSTKPLVTSVLINCAVGYSEQLRVGRAVATLTQKYRKNSPCFIRRQTLRSRGYGGSLTGCGNRNSLITVRSCHQKSIGLKFSQPQTGNDVRYSCHHNSSRFTFPIFAHS